MANENGIPSSQVAFVDGRGVIAAVWFNLLVSLWQRTGGGTGGGGSSGSIQSGTILPWAGAGTVPTGYLACDGAAVNRITYADLFDVCGITWGPGDGAVTFNLPDLRDRTLFGANDSTVLLGQTGGSNSATLNIGNLPAHTHGVNDPTHNHGILDNGHNHGQIQGPVVVVQSGSDYGVVGAGTDPTGTSGTGISIFNSATGISLQNTGSGDPVTTKPRFAGVRYMIKT